jgi:C1A family cysteine protease
LFGKEFRLFFYSNILLDPKSKDIPTFFIMEITYRLGWQKDLPDFRDYNENTDAVSEALSLLEAPKKIKLSKEVDLRMNCSTIHDQLTIGSCTAQAAVSLIEFLELKAYGKCLDFSRLFLYKTTRNLLNWQGDTGAYIRTTIGALALFGVPPEKFQPYSVLSYDEEPTAFLYSLAKNFTTLTYYRLDTPGKKTEDLLSSIKESLAKGLPPMFGFSVYDSISQANHSGDIPFPINSDRSQGGHAVLAVGYDDNKKIKHSRSGTLEYTGAFLIQNSWGEGWGDHGFGWLPYEYVLRGLAVDWWVIVDKKYIETGQFGF